MAEQAQPLNALIINAGQGRQDAVALGNDIFMSRCVSNLYRVLTPGGDEDEPGFRELGPGPIA